jgi:Tannase-like family of unknown function (DUF6351)
VLVVGALVVAGCSSDDGGGNATEGVPAAATSDQVTEGVTTTATSDEGGLTLTTLSTRAEAVSGGDVLVAAGGEVEPGDITVTVSGPDGSDDVTGDFAEVEGALQGLIDGLPEGESTIEASGGGETVTLTVNNHPLSGPIFSGPHLEPWVCHTEEAGLGAPRDDDCTVDPVTTVEDGVRIEQGVIDRGIYTLTMPDDTADWNGRLVYRFGGGCGTTYGQGFDLGSGGVDEDLMDRGYAVATNTLDTFQTICNPTVSAEAALMTREHFVETYGVPDFTIGDGGSGGAIQQLLIAQNQPGLLDGLSPAAPFPDALSIAAGVSDCGLLVHYYGTPEGSQLSGAQRAAINDQLTSGTCVQWDDLFVSGIDPTDGCDPGIPAEDVYDADTNPDGVRCDLQDSNVGVLGVDPDTGFAYRPLSSEGVQYGLAAFRDGVIDAEQFVGLNEHIGGYDIDGNIVPERTTISDDTAALAYQVGAVTGAGPLQDLPIILRSPYTDPLADIHTRYHAFSVRQRLQVDGEDDPNLVLWTTPAGGGDLVGVLTGNVGNNEPIVLLDEWLTTGGRPDAVTNRCVLPDGTLLSGGWELYDDPGPCRDAFPVMGDPRTGAGGPTTGDVIACQLAPLEEVDADLDLSADQLDRLATVFPTGVCDWSQPGRGQQPPSGEWQDFGS